MGLGRHDKFCKLCMTCFKIEADRVNGVLAVQLSLNGTLWEGTSVRSHNVFPEQRCFLGLRFKLFEETGKLC